jgi:signal transduction histidine kinase
MSSEPARPASVLWAEALQDLASLIAHDLRNALNAVAVNLEVVRGRSARGTEASGIASFAATAASNFESAAAATEALLALARAESALVVDVAAIATRIGRLLSVRATNAVQVVDRSAGRATTEISGDMVRAAVARSVLTALSASERIACEITVDDGIFVRVTGATDDPPRPDSELAAAALAYGIHFASRGQSLELRIPTVDQRATQHVSS